ncbi:MAG: ParA family protein [Epulopiscium sp.]|nr:ParA family protein [Candidatus Epulonipiscium sp.]
MGKIISIVNQKGGVGKTTTVINLAASLNKLEYKVLVVDMDPQGNASSGCGIEKNKVSNTIYDYLIGNIGIKDIIYKTPIEKFDIIPANMNLAGADIELSNQIKREFLLSKGLEEIKDNYDFIIIDCPPAVNLLTINSLTASDSVIIPMQCEYYALEGISQLMQTIKLIKGKTNKDLALEGILFTMHDSRTNLSRQVIEEVKKYFSKYVYETKITRSVRLSEAPSYGVSCITYAPNSKSSKQYMEFTKEVLERNNKNESKRTR